MKSIVIIFSLLLAIVKLTFALPNHAKGNVIFFDSTNSFQRIEEYATFYFDEQAILSASQIVQKYNENKFSTFSSANSNFTLNFGTIWIAMEVSNSSKEPLYINFRNVFMERIKIYSLINNQLITNKETGAQLPFNSRAFETGSYITEIPYSTNRNTTLMLCAISIETGAPMIIRGHIGTLSSILRHNRMHEFIAIGVLGILVVMLFYNASLFIVTHDKLYLYYSSYLTASVILVMWFNGFLFEWLWPNNPSLNKYPWVMGVYFFTQLLFINKMLQVKKESDNFHKIARFLQLVAIFIFITAFTNLIISTILIFACALIIPIYYISIIKILLNKKEKIIYIFILGWGPMLAVTVLNTLMNLGLIGYSEAFDLHGVEVSLAWEVVIFSLALGYRYNLIKQETITVQHENINIIENQKIILEQMVSERTEEIVAQNEALIRNQDQIQTQNEKLESQNRAYEKLRELVLKQNQNLESAVNKRTIELADANQELKNNLRKIERFNFIAAHNLRGPVARILGLCMLVEKEETIKDSINYQIIEKLKYSTKELDTIIHDLILVLDIQTQNDKNYKRINPEELIQKVFQQFNTELKKENFVVEINSLISAINVIPEYFDNIFNNLISNSLKYKSPVNENRITIIIEESENNIVIHYKDKGIGFESEHFQDKVFEPFQKFHANSDGKGLGIFLIKSQISAMGGEINLWSKPNLGIDITIYLPEITKNQQKSSSQLIKS